MVDDAQVFAWLNRYDHSRLGVEALGLLQRVRDEMLPPDQRARAAEMAARAVKDNENLLEQAETFVRLSRFWHTSGQPERAIAFLKEALAVYQQQPDQHHRQGVVYWLLGCIEWRQHLNSQACGRWRDACRIFEGLAEDCEDARQPEMAAWYREALREFNIDLALTPEEAYTWLNYFTPGFLESDLVALRNHVFQAINRGDYRQANQAVRQMITLANARHDLDERAEAYLESGLARYQLLDLADALTLVRTAVALYRPHSHWQAVARWMLGLLEWMQTAYQVDALNDFTLSLDSFHQLLADSNHNGQRGHVQWYSQRIEILGLAKARRIPQ